MNHSVHSDKFREGYMMTKYRLRRPGNTKLSIITLSLLIIGAFILSLISPYFRKETSTGVTGQRTY